MIKHLHCLFVVINENEPALIIGSKLHPFLRDDDWVQMGRLRSEYIPTFVAIFHKCISFFRLGSIFKRRRRSLPQADKWLSNPLFSLSQITLVDRKLLASKRICIEQKFN